MEQPSFKRKLRSVAQRLKFTKKSIVVTVPTAKLPPELSDEAVLVDFPPPAAAELEGGAGQADRRRRGSR